MKQFIKGVFSEGDQPSFGRVSAGIIIAFALGWGTAILVTQKKIDADNVLQLLQGAAYFYVGNKLSTAFAGKVSAVSGDSTKTG